MNFPVYLDSPASGLWKALPFLLIFFAFKATGQPVLNANDLQKEQLASQRFHYQKAKLALAGGKMAEYREHLAKIDDYPLKQYLEFTEIRRELTSLPGGWERLMIRHGETVAHFGVAGAAHERAVAIIAVASRVREAELELDSSGANRTQKYIILKNEKKTY